MKPNDNGYGVTTRKIVRVAKRIASRFSPDRVILFGSWARGDANSNSDADLLVVMPVRGSKRRKMLEISAAVHDIRIAADIVVVTPEEFREYADIVGTIVYPAVREGRVLYARS
jgi:predicted nucleotidyltransferase